MQHTFIYDIPPIYSTLQSKSREIGFTMNSDLYIGSLLKTLATAKPQANILELGTGVGLTLSWMLAGMDTQSYITSIDNDPQLIELVQRYLGDDPRLTLICTDGADWIQQYQGEPFDLVFADAWPGKYSELEEILALIRTGGLYVIDDMQPQPNWPDGHQDKADKLIAYLKKRADFHLTQLDWSTGVIIAAKKFI